ncbi:hypothetical protein WJX74_010934 [Apatococcus lobatus]|uniref:Squalene synthase n=1 Tax=Apatococcus lobatus TaxID=904363 RepID=A0AAW1QME1_9CHLO
MNKLQPFLEHPDEIWPTLQAYWAAQQTKKLPKQPDLAFCYGTLPKVSRSFAIVIQQLPEGLRDAFCVFYLVLRALDTVEDDMSIPIDKKVPLLHAFHNLSQQRGWTTKAGVAEYADLMAGYPAVIQVYLQLDQQYCKVIDDVCRRMGAGMADFITDDVITVDDYDLYCHYVAGLVGVGSSQLFAASGLESEQYAAADELSNHMGLFLQKTNIIRDYLEDIMEEPAPRMFWPREIWGKYVSSLDDLRHPQNEAAALHCLNHMICDALRHAPHSLEYMVGLRNYQIFRFCAIPQVMAIATLALCYNNPAVFRGKVKMRRGQTAKYMMETDSMQTLLEAFMDFGTMLCKKAKSHRIAMAKDPTRETVVERLGVLQQRAAELQALDEGVKAPVNTGQVSWAARAPLFVAVIMILVALRSFWMSVL